MLGFLGLAYSIYPYVVIGRLTLWQAASSPQALKVILLGVCISVPAIAGYTVFSLPGVSRQDLGTEVRVAGAADRLVWPGSVSSYSPLRPHPMGAVSRLAPKSQARALRSCARGSLPVHRMP